MPMMFPAPNIRAFAVWSKPFGPNPRITTVSPVQKPSLGCEAKSLIDPSPRTSEWLCQHSDLWRHAIRHLIDIDARNDVHVLGPAPKKMRRLFTAQGKTIGLPIVAPGKTPRIATLITVATPIVTTHHDAVAFLEFLVIELKFMACFRSNLGHNPDILVSRNDWVLDATLSKSTRKQSALALVTVFVGSADARHLHLHQHCPIFEFWIREMPGLDFARSRHHCRAYALYHSSPPFDAKVNATRQALPPIEEDTLSHIAKAPAPIV